MIQKLITDRELRSAAAAVRCAMLESFPGEIGLPFSPGFAQRMDALRDAERKRAHRRQIRDRILAATVAVFLVISMLLSFNPDVRAAVAGWFKEVFDTYTHYWFTEEPIDTLPAFVVKSLPDGCDLIFEETTENTKTVIYQKGDDIDDGFVLLCGKLINGSPLQIGSFTDNYNSEEVLVNGLPGDLYVSISPEESHGLIWIDEVNGVYFYISSYFDPETILQIAESVEIKK